MSVGELISYFEKERISFMRIKHMISRSNICLKKEVNYLKAKQYQSIECALKGDVLSVLPTGYGKTVIFQTLPFQNDDKCVVVITPLNSILCEQHALLGDVSVLVQGEIDLQRVSSRTRYILGHPEVITSDWMKKYLRGNAELCKRITHIVIDEAHCILSWGKSRFRPSFLRISSLRAILNGANILALTATATTNSQREILNELLAEKGTVISQSPDRPNVFLEVKKRLPSTGGSHNPDDSINDVTDPYLQELKEKGRMFPKTILYAKLVTCGYIHNRALTTFLSEHPDETTVQQSDACELHCLIQQYHAPQTDSMKSLITQEMRKDDGQLRLLLATEAYGMGTDAPDIRRVIHLGPPSSIETYIQEIGRCGRDGERACAQLYYNATDIAKNVKHLEESMREYCQLKTCRRKFLLKHFDFEHTVNTVMHNCCDNCVLSCRCFDCLLYVTTSLLGDLCISSTCMDAHLTVTSGQKRNLTELLKLYFASENLLVENSTLPHVVTGLSEQLATSISAKAYHYKDFVELKHDFPHLKQSFLENIVSIINQILP